VQPYQGSTGFPRITAPISLNKRQKEVLAVLLKYEFVGPQLVADVLDISISTAHRDLKVLEADGLVERTKHKKSTLTKAGFDYVEYLSSL
jgi:DeoR/GlpR family transcriptional regulator of sugar metabolism